MQPENSNSQYGQHGQEPTPTYGAEFVDLGPYLLTNKLHPGVEVGTFQFIARGATIQGRLSYAEYTPGILALEFFELRGQGQRERLKPYTPQLKLYAVYPSVNMDGEPGETDAGPGYRSDEMLPFDKDLDPSCTNPTYFYYLSTKGVYEIRWNDMTVWKFAMELPHFPRPVLQGIAISEQLREVFRGKP